MKKLKLLIVIFSLALSIPLAYFVVRTYRGLEQEEVATLRFFADTLFDKMEGALAEMVKKEEGRAIDEFNYEVFPSDRQTDAGKPQPSPLSRPPRENYVLGYFQNNPDGSFQTPLVAGAGTSPPDFVARIEASGAKVLRGTCFYQQHAREIGEANGWTRLCWKKPFGFSAVTLTAAITARKKSCCLPLWMIEFNMGVFPSRITFARPEVRSRIS